MKNIAIISIWATTVFTLFSCYQFEEASCQEAAEGNRPDNVNLVVTESSGSAYKLRLDGFDPATNKKNVFQKQNYTWAQWFIKKISVGDTVVKNKGELKFYIHRKDTVLVFPFECDGEIYE
jgi:hypothetical protein